MTILPPWSPGKTHPSARRSDHVDVYKSAEKGEVWVPDPYHWMEQYTEETIKWATAQGAYARLYLDQHFERSKLQELFLTCMNYPRFSAPTLLDDGYWYWFYNTGLQGQAALYRSKEASFPDFSKDDTVIGEVFFDPNLVPSDGSVSMAAGKFSRCGTNFAYGLSFSGNDYLTIFIRPSSFLLSQAALESNGRDNRYPDEIKYVKFSTLAWTTDAKGLFYQRYPAVGDVMERIQSTADRDAAVYYHVVGTPQADDILIFYDKEHPEWTYGTDTSEDGKYLYMQIFQDTGKKNLLWIAEIDKGQIYSGLKWRKIVNEFTAEYILFSNRGSVLYIITDENAPQRKVVTIDLSKEKPPIREFIPEDKGARLTQITGTNKTYFVAVYKRNVKDEIYIYSQHGTQLVRLAPNFVGSVSISNREKQSHFFVIMSGFTTPGIIGRYDFTAPEGQRWSIFRTTKVDGLNPDDFESRQVWYDSKDGTKIPMFIICHKSTKLDGTAAAIQYGYGGFGIPVDPFFSPTILAFLQAYGAILAVPNIRGGSEFGREWHEAGCRENKHNVFDDFIAAGEYLVENKYATKGKIALNGASNGGMLVGGTITRAPEGLFGAAIAEGGVLDLLKFNKYTTGVAWTSEYGDPNVPADFDFTYPMSPVHNVPKDRVMPATLIMTSMDDERVVPMHSYKFVAQLQHAAPQNPNPLLLRVEKGGHGAGKSTSKRLNDSLDKLGFIAQALGLKLKETY